MVLLGKAKIKLHVLLELPPASLKYPADNILKHKMKYFSSLFWHFFYQTIYQFKFRKKIYSSLPHLETSRRQFQTYIFFKGWPFYIYIYIHGLDIFDDVLWHQLIGIEYSLELFILSIVLNLILNFQSELVFLYIINYRANIGI